MVVVLISLSNIVITYNRISIRMKSPDSLRKTLELKGLSNSNKIQK